MPKVTLGAVWFSDDGHAWLAVPETAIKALGIESRISGYSYKAPKEGIVFLEEDCDAPEFISAANAAGICLNIREKRHAGDSPIRDLPRY
jgi:hypothetical protein